MFGMGGFDFSFINKLSAQFNNPTARAAAHNPFAPNPSYSPAKFTIPPITFTPPVITAPTTLPTRPTPNTSPLTGMSTRTFNQAKIDEISNT